jgi:hypothetical protein
MLRERRHRSAVNGALRYRQHADSPPVLGNDGKTFAGSLPSFFLLHEPVSLLNSWHVA